MNERKLTQSNLITVKEAAEAFGVHPQTLRAWLADGAPHVRIGKIVRVDVAELRAWASKSTTPRRRTTGGGKRMSSKPTTLRQRKNALKKLGSPNAGGARAYVYTKTAAELLGISTKSLQSFISPVEYVSNPHYKSGPDAALWDPVHLARIANQKRVQAARECMGRKRPRDFAPVFQKRYGDARSAIADAIELLWNLNRYAKHASCTHTHKDTIYELKSEFLESLARFWLSRWRRRPRDAHPRGDPILLAMRGVWLRSVFGHRRLEGETGIRLVVRCSQVRG